MAQTLLGVYIQDNRLALTSIKRSLRQENIDAQEIYILENQESADDKKIDEVANKIRKFCEKNKLKSASVVLSLNWKDFLWYLVEMPPVSKTDLVQLLTYELDMHIPLDPKSVYFDALSLVNSGKTNNQALLVTSPQSVIDSYIEMIHRAGLKLYSVEPAPVSRWRSLLKCAAKEINSDYLTILSLGETESDCILEILIAHNKQPLLYRTLASKPLSYQSSQESDDDLEDTSPGTSHPAMGIIEAIRMSHMSLGRLGTPNDIQRVLLLGNTAARWRETLQQNCTDIVFDVVETRSDDSLDMNLLMLTAYGAALKDLEETESINILPASLRPSQKHHGLIVVGAIAGLFSAMAVMVMANDYWKTDLKLLDTKAHISSLQDDVKTVMQINEEYDAISERFQFFKSMNQEYPSQLMILKELTRILPSKDTETSKKVYLDEYEFRENQITIRGESESPEEIITILEESPYFEKVHFDGTVSGKRFTIQANLSKYQTAEEELPEEDFGEERPGEMGSKPGETPTPKAEPTEVAKPQAAEDHSTEQEPREVYRGPAFPRTQTDTLPEEPTDYQEPEPYPPHESEMPADGERDPEEIEEMKENLLDFIRKHKEEGNVIERDRDYYEEPDPDEAAANFLEFLKSASENQATENME
ncbi:hypothetical protein JW979_15100 [bacterium]|nr:hypothetical protein [candidate division CSSED10-310 bacterium]